MKINYILFFLFSVQLFFILACKQSNAENLNPKEPRPVPQDHALLIESLKKRTYGPGEIAIEKSLGNKGKFESYIASYDSDGLKLYTLLNIPRRKKEKYPVIIVNHGYIPPGQYSTEKSYQLVSNYYAANGFMVLKPDYRGHDQSQSGQSHFLDRLSYVIDVLNLYYSLGSLPEADLDQVFIYGHSMGGGITLAVLEIVDQIKAATLWAPVSVEYPESTLYFIRKTSAASAENYLNRVKQIFKAADLPRLSPSNYIHLIQTPLLLHHGKEDESVPYAWSVELVKKMKQNEIDYRFYSYENEDHNFARKNFYTVLKRDVDFFKSYLK